MKTLLLNFWVSPRNTVRYFSKQYEEKEYAVMTFFVFSTALSSVFNIASKGLSIAESAVLLIISVIIGLLIWLTISKVYSYVAHKFFKLQTDSYKIRQAIALNAFVGSIWNNLFLLLIFLLGLSMQDTILLWIIVLGVWHAICSLSTLREMMNTGPWKTIFILLTPLLILFLITIIFIIMFVTSMNFLNA